MEGITEPTQADPTQTDTATTEESPAAPESEVKDATADTGEDTEPEGLDDLDDLDDVDFDLDEVENKIAPLALAENESARW